VEIEKIFFELFNNLPGIVFLAKQNQEIIGVMRIKSCIGKVFDAPDIVEDEKDCISRCLRGVGFTERLVEKAIQQNETIIGG
jgi:hypothetical protein